MDEGMCALYTGDQYPVRYGLALTSESASFDHVTASACQLDTSVSPSPLPPHLRIHRPLFLSTSAFTSPLLSPQVLLRRFTGRPPALADATTARPSISLSLRQLVMLDPARIGPPLRTTPCRPSRYYL